MLIKNILITSLVLWSGICSAARIESGTNGIWDDATTWIGGNVPADGDTAVISALHVVDVDCNCGTYVNFRIEVYGTLDFLNGKKLTMDASSEVQIYAGGLLTGGNGGSKIIIGGVGKWDGSEGDVTGPAYTNTITTGFTQGILPIELLNFNAEVTEENSIRIHWSTAQEINNDFFTIERSYTGSNFREFVEIPGAGNSREELSYEIYDNEPLEGDVFYRLKQTDYDGNYEYFSIVGVSFESNHIKTAGCRTLSVFPNPCIGECQVKLSNCEEDIRNDFKIEILDVFGRIITSEMPHKQADGSLTYSINTTNDFSPGIYIVNGFGSNAKSQKIIVK